MGQRDIRGYFAQLSTPSMSVSQCCAYSSHWFRGPVSAGVGAEFGAEAREFTAKTEMN